MQPSLAHVLVPDKIARLTALGWQFDPSFGNYVQTFPAELPTRQIADVILQVLAEGYDADLPNLEVDSDWIVHEKCPPRNGPSQNLAGRISDAPSMKSTSVHACAYSLAPDHDYSPLIHSVTDLINVYGKRVTGEIQRLRINSNRRVHVVLSTDIGYVQCAPDAPPPAIYCEAQSADSWPALASILTTERVTRLHAAGFIDPGRAPNYSKIYLIDQNDDASIARELLTILYEVYGYTGSPKLKFATEKGD